MRDQVTRMWQSTISLRYVSYKNADSNLHERICAMAMNLSWSCAPIVAPRPPINPQRPNQAMERGNPNHNSLWLVLTWIWAPIPMILAPHVGPLGTIHIWTIALPWSVFVGMCLGFFAPRML